MRVCFATSECVPFVKTGGLADVSGALPKALAELGVEIKVFLPLYGSINTIDHQLTFAHDLYNIPLQIGDKHLMYNVWHKKAPGLSLEYYFIEYSEYYHRDSIYTSDPDEDERFILLQNAAFQIMQRYSWSPDLIHCNDWQTALMPVYLRKKYHWDRLFSQTASLLSIHNIGYQGQFSDRSIYKAGLPYDDYYPGGPFEFQKSFSFLKAGMVYADIISTVSETYATEIQSPAFGSGLDGVLATRSPDLIGILNGIDPSEWNPRVDELIPHNYDVDTIEDKKHNKRALANYTNLPYDENVPVIGVITRLAVQKGMELIASAFDDLIQLPVQFVFLGSGEKKYEDFLRHASSRYPEKIYAYLGFNNELAHLIEAGADMFLMPSRYEPCGLNQMYSLNYGTVPIVRKTGGLADTVTDYHEHDGKGNGFSFYDFTPFALTTSVQRALALFQDKQEWRKIMKRGMAADFSWKKSAQKYVEVYSIARSRRG